jgi:hypothetical protein
MKRAGAILPPRMKAMSRSGVDADACLGAIAHSVNEEQRSCY